MDLVLKEKLAVINYNRTFGTSVCYLKSKQIECLRAAINSDVMTVLPTGYGKSLIFELVPFYTLRCNSVESVVIIVMPLNVIIQQEVEKLQNYAYHVTMDCKLYTNKMYQYFIGHPEDILARVSELSKITKLFDKTYVVIDEAHCVVEWGDDFRPDYKLIADLRVHMPSCSFLACTATASKEAQLEISRCLGMSNPTYIRNIPIINKNICLLLNKRMPSTGGENSAKDAYNFVYKPLILELYEKGVNFPLTIVYCKLYWCAYGVELSRRLLGPSFQLEGLCDEAHFCVAQYHAQQPKEANEQIVELLSSKESPIRLVFATVALGMGSDLRYVERVYHAGVPSSLEAYTQEIGRAGRGGAECEARMLFNNTDLAQRHVPQSLKDFCKQQMCRREILSTYFDSPVAPAQVCCDVCLNIPRSTDFFLPKLKDRVIVSDFLTTYKESDSSDISKLVLSENLIIFISETYEFVDGVESLSQTYKIPLVIAEALFTIINLTKLTL